MYVNPSLLIPPTTPVPLNTHIFVLYVCVSISALQIRSSILFTRWTWVWVNSGSWWWTGRPGMLQFMGSQRVGHDWATELNWYYLPGISVVKSMPTSARDMGSVPEWGDPWRWKWPSTPVFLPGKSNGQRNQVGYSPWGWKELDMTEHSCVHMCARTHRHIPFFLGIY